MKKYLILLVVILAIGIGAFFFRNQPQDSSQDQVVLESTLDISKEYASLRYRTDNVLIGAKNFGDYDAWNTELREVIYAWQTLEEGALALESSAEKLGQERASSKLVSQAVAYTKEEVTSVIDSAPMGKKIATLAKHLGVDAKMAQLILNETQNMISREAYGEEGDVFQTCENQAIVVKNASKVTVFVGTIAITGGTAALASGSTLAQAAVVVSGADLTLEITDDTAKMALGNKNQLSALVGDVRKITEPASAILMVSTLPTNLVKGIDKLNAVVFGADQLNSTIQSGSVLGIKLPTYTQAESAEPMQVSVMEKEELGTWLTEQGIPTSTESKVDVEEIIGITSSIDSAVAEEGQKGNADPSSTDRMSIAEYNELSDKGKLNTMGAVKQYFGEPNLSTVSDTGSPVFIYLNRIENQDGVGLGIRFGFYTLDEYQQYAESYFGWDQDYQDIWDASEGGLVSTSEVKGTDDLKNMYDL